MAPRRVRLNLGCGDDPRLGFLNVDAHGDAADARMEARALAVADGALGRIDALHVLEHLGYVGAHVAVAEWRRALAPGGLLVVETPDLPATARAFAAGDRATRARLVDWIYGLESPGMSHRFGFEEGLLRALLAAYGFVAVRREPARAHPAYPGLRLLARRRGGRRVDGRAAFVRAAWSAGLLEGEQAVALERVGPVAEAVGRGLAAGPAGLERLLAELVVRDPAEADLALALAAARPRRWRALLAAPAIRAWPERLAAGWLAAPPAPGTMAAAYQRARRAALAELAGHPSRPPPLTLPRGLDRPHPFSPAGLAAASRRALVRGLARFARGDRPGARLELERAAAWNADAPTPLWNLGRLDALAGDTARARARLAAAARLAAPPAAAAILAEAEALGAGARPRAWPASPTRPGDEA